METAQSQKIGVPICVARVRACIAFAHSRGYVYITPKHNGNLQRSRLCLYKLNLRGRLHSCSVRGFAYYTSWIREGAYKVHWKAMPGAFAASPIQAKFERASTKHTGKPCLLRSRLRLYKLNSRGHLRSILESHSCCVRPCTLACTKNLTCLGLHTLVRWFLREISIKRAGDR